MDNKELLNRLVGIQSRISRSMTKSQGVIDEWKTVIALNGLHDMVSNLMNDIKDGKLNTGIRF